MVAVLIAFLIFISIGMPVAFAIGLSGVVFFLNNPEIPFSIVTQRVVTSTQSLTLLAIPLFIFAGNLMNSSGITSRLIKLSNVLTGHLSGGLAQVTVLLSTLMGGVSGSAVSDAAMQARILGPDMIKAGYSKGYSAAIIGLSGLIVSTIPPSMGLILYGSVGEVSIGRLFAAGIVPGVMLMVALMIAVSITAKKKDYKPANVKRATFKEVLIAIKECIWALMFPIILIVGIRFGIFTPSEAGAFAAVYAIFVGAVIHKELTWKKFKITLKDSIGDIGSIMLIIALSGIFGYGIVYDQVPQKMAELMLGLTSNPTLLLLLIIVFLLIAGMFVEGTVCVLLLTPIFLPILKNVGVDPVLFGVVMLIVINIGLMTPPVGVSLFSVSSIIDCPTEETIKESIPFYVAIIIVIAIIILFPNICLFIPNLIYGV